MADINLLQQNKKLSSGFSRPNLTLPASSGKGFLVFLIFLLVLEIGAYAGLYFLRSGLEEDIAGIEGEITSTQSTIDQRREELDVAIATQARVSALKTLLEDHIRWTNVWDELAEHTLSTSYFATIEAATETNSFIVSGIVPTYTDLGKVILGLELSDKFSDVLLQSASFEQGEGVSGVSYDLTILMDDNFLVESE